MPKQDLDEAFLRSLLEGDEVEMSVVFSDPSLLDNPMIFVSDEFESNGWPGYLAQRRVDPLRLDADRGAGRCCPKGTAEVDAAPVQSLSSGRRRPQQDGVAAPTLPRRPALRPSRAAFLRRHGGS